MARRTSVFLYTLRRTVSGRSLSRRAVSSATRIFSNDVSSTISLLSNSSLISDTSCFFSLNGRAMVKQLLAI